MESAVLAWNWFNKSHNISSLIAHARESALCLQLWKVLFHPQVGLHFIPTLEIIDNKWDSFRSLALWASKCYHSRGVLNPFHRFNVSILFTLEDTLTSIQRLFDPFSFLELKSFKHRTKIDFQMMWKMFLKFLQVLILTTPLHSLLLILVLKWTRVILFDSFFLYLSIFSTKNFFFSPFSSLKLNSISLAHSLVFTSVHKFDEAPTAAFVEVEKRKIGIWIELERDYFSFQNNIKIAFEFTRNLSNWNAVFSSTHSARRLRVFVLPSMWESFSISLS